MSILFNKKIILIAIIFISIFFVPGLFNFVHAQAESTDFSEGSDFGNIGDFVEPKIKEGSVEDKNLDDAVKKFDGTYVPTQVEKDNIHDSVYGEGGNFPDPTIRARTIQDIRREARSEFTALNPIPGVTDAEAAESPSKFFNGMFMFGISIAAFLAVLMIAIGGIQYMSTDAVSGKSEGRERIIYAVMGLLLVLFSWILLRQINPEILDFNFLDSSAKIINLIIYV